MFLHVLAMYNIDWHFNLYVSLYVFWQNYLVLIHFVVLHCLNTTHKENKHQG